MAGMTYEEHLEFIRTNTTAPIELTTENIEDFIVAMGEVLEEIDHSTELEVGDDSHRVG